MPINQFYEDTPSLQHEDVAALLDAMRTPYVPAKAAFSSTEKELRRLNSLFRNKVIPDEHIANSIFECPKFPTALPPEKNTLELIKNYERNHLTAAYYSFCGLRETMEKVESFTDEGIHKYSQTIINFILDVHPFATDIGRTQDPKYNFFTSGKNPFENSRWHYEAAKQLLYNQNLNLGYRMGAILSSVTLRQTLELKIQRILGIQHYYDTNGQNAFVNQHFFFDFIKKNMNHFEAFPVKIPILQKILTFCNKVVHRGMIPTYWQMFYAFKFCDLLFSYKIQEEAKSIHIDGAIRITDYETLKNTLLTELNERFPNPEYNLCVDWMNPEAQIVS